jgi:competence protein ComEA
MKQFMRDYFSFNRRERRGISVLLGILALLFFALAYMHSGEFIQGKNGTLEEVKFEQAEEIHVHFKKEKPEWNKTPTEEKKKRKPEYFYFDPNAISQEGLEKLGLSEKQSKTIVNYVSKGGKFRKKEDLKKIYSIRDEDYERLEHYVRIPEDSIKKVPKQSGETKEQNKITVSNKIKSGEYIELNGADTSTLIKLPCIGPSFARRIVAFRTRIGGFVSIDQLKEIFGFDDERFNCMSDRIEVDLSKIHKLNINTSTSDELKKHPYIRWNVAKLIESYRNQHGPYHSLDELKKLALIDEALFIRISPYLSIE